MTRESPSPPAPFAAAEAARAAAPGTTREAAGSVSPSVCGRVLLYTRGMEIAPLLGLELALETVRRVAAAPAPGAPHAAAGEAPASSGLSAEESRGPAAAMRELQALLHERRIGFHVTGPDGRELRSAPPMQRRPMIAEEMDITPLRSALKKFFRKLSGQTPDKGKGRTP